MWIADQWKDYEVIDCSKVPWQKSDSGEKLETGMGTVHSVICPLSSG